MAKVDLRKLKDQANKAIEKMAYAKAAELYLVIAQHEPGDADWRQRAGEALRKAHEPAQAAAQFVLAAEGYAKAGFLLKAIAVFKLVLQIDPKHTATQARLAELYAQRDGGRPPSVMRPPLPAAPPPQPQRAPVIAAPLTPAATDEVVGLDERNRPRTIPPGAPMEVVPLASVLGGRRSAQFAAVALEEVTDGIEPDAGAYEISLDDSDLSLAVSAASEDRRQEEPIAIEIAVEPEPAPTLARLDDELDFGGLLDDAPPPPAPARAAPLPKIPLLSSLSSDQLRQVIERVEMRELAANEVVVRQGERGGSLFVVVSGRVRVVLEGPPRREVASLGEGEFFGELALLTDFPRSATVAADEPTQLLEFSRELVSDVVADSPEVLRTLLRFFRDRLLDRLMGTSELFKSFNAGDARSLAARFMFLELEPKMRVVREGERAPGLFMLLCGEAYVVRGNQRIAAIAPGDVFGEMSLLTGGPAMASIDTGTKCWALELPRSEFQEIMLTYPQVLEYVSTVAERRKEKNLGPDHDRVDFL